MILAFEISQEKLEDDSKEYKGLQLQVVVMTAVYTAADSLNVSKVELTTETYDYKLMLEH